MGSIGLVSTPQERFRPEEKRHRAQRLCRTFDIRRAGGGRVHRFRAPAVSGSSRPDEKMTSECATPMNRTMRIISRAGLLLEFSLDLRLYGPVWCSEAPPLEGAVTPPAEKPRCCAPVRAPAPGPCRSESPRLALIATCRGHQLMRLLTLRYCLQERVGHLPAVQLQVRAWRFCDDFDMGDRGCGRGRWRRSRSMSRSLGHRYLRRRCDVTTKLALAGTPGGDTGGDTAGWRKTMAAVAAMARAPSTRHPS